MMKTILSNLTERLSLLESGKLTQAEMELFVEDSKELYERLIILRYKLYETQVFVPHAIVEPTLLEQEVPEISEVEKPTFDLFDLEEESISNEEEETGAIEVGLFNIGVETPEVSIESSVKAPIEESVLPTINESTNITVLPSVEILVDELIKSIDNNNQSNSKINEDDIPKKRGVKAKNNFINDNKDSKRTRGKKIIL